jgi:hypothetical protein
MFQYSTPDVGFALRSDPGGDVGFSLLPRVGINVQQHRQNRPIWLV